MGSVSSSITISVIYSNILGPYISNKRLMTIFRVFFLIYLTISAGIWPLYLPNTSSNSDSLGVLLILGSIVKSCSISFFFSTAFLYYICKLRFRDDKFFHNNLFSLININIIKKKCNMQEKSKPYMLFIFSEFQKESTILKDIPLQLSPISSSKYLKYNYTDSTVVCNFESNLPFEDLREFIDSTIGLIVEQWYLFEHPDKMAVHIPDTFKVKFCFDLETENRKYEQIENKQDDDEMLKIMDYFLSNSIKNLNNEEIESFYFNEEEEDSLMKELKLKKNVTFVKPTLDELLEKVKESGVEKLTKYEKQILDEYARN